MPVHDWTLVNGGVFHTFHQSWTISLFNALNAGVLPADYYAMVENYVGEVVPDVLTLRLAAENEPNNVQGGLAVATVPPQTRLVRRSEQESYSAKANRIVIRDLSGDIVAAIEIVSPGNKASKAKFQAFVDKSVTLIKKGIHLLVVDVFPPGKRDPQGIHKAIWEQFEDEELEVPLDKPLTLASYDAGPERVAYVEFVGVCDTLPSMPLFLKPGIYVPAPLESAYQNSWNSFPAAVRRLLEKPSGPPLRSPPA